MINSIFVYGTLKPGFCNEKYTSKIATPKIKRAYVKGYLLYDLGSYPAVGRGDGIVEGFLCTYETKDIKAVLKEIDLLEEFLGPGNPNNLYDRLDCFVETEDGQEEAWIYVFSSHLSESNLVHSSVWTEKQ